MRNFAVTIVRQVDELTGIRDAWNTLATNVADHSFSQSYEYISLAAEIASASGHELKILTAWDQDTLVGAWPLSLSKEGPFRLLRPLSCGSNEEYSTPLTREAGKKEIVATLFHKAQALGADVLQIFNVRADDVFNTTIQASSYPTTMDTLPAYGICLEQFPNWNSFAASLSKSLRTSLKYEAGRLGKLGHLEAGWCKTGTEASAVLHWIIDTKRRWAKANHRSAPWLSKPHVMDFFIALANRIDLSNAPMISYLKLDGTPIAASINLIGPSSVEYFITTFNDDFAPYSPGKLLIEHCVQWSVLNRRNFDFRILHGDYKARWSNSQTTYNTYTLFLTRRGRLKSRLVAAERLAGRGRRMIGRLLGGTLMRRGQDSR
ncbi:MAG TPA: GNAT family N-acetyltransferase [Rhizomicrobium sp.]|jgi:CelD/BcsL family acetyltransferase involved in cellulose biosynthesis|nr:GNAT family N-acetyltransferase [Rhizomicrobium sp.]